jgi:N-acetylglutamate synthase-like GNAT family acetyltransferase
MSDVEELLQATGFADSDPRKGTVFIARDGKVVGCVRLVEVVPNTLVMDDVVVQEDRRNEGIGRQLVQAAMNSRAGTMYLCCHEEKKAFYGHFGFTDVSPNALPEPVSNYFADTGDLNPPEGHGEHFFFAARA